MKTRLRVIPLLMCLVVLTLSAVLTQRAVAKDTDSENVTFNEPIMVAGTLLEANSYRLVWDEGAPEVQVSFMKGSKTMVTVPARLVLEPSRYDGAIGIRTLDDNSRILEKITWKKKSLVFEQSS